MIRSDPGAQFPQATRAVLRVEFAGGKVREFEAEHPRDLECVIQEPPRAFLSPLDLASPVMIASDTVIDVRLGFHASRNPRDKMEMRTEAARSPQQVLDEVRAQAEEWAQRDVDPHRMDRPMQYAGNELLAILDRR